MLTFSNRSIIVKLWKARETKTNQVPSGTKGVTATVPESLKKNLNGRETEGTL